MTLRKHRNLHRRRIAATVLIMAALLTGCGGKNAQQTEPDEPIEMALAWSTPVPPAATRPPLPGTAATPEPDMIFDNSGNITLSGSYQAKFSEQTYSFGHAPRVLIYHTHAREAYREETTPAPNSTATPLPESGGEMRTTDQTRNVVHLGDVLAKELQKRGFTVFHDVTDVEEPSLSTAYERSRKVMASYENIDIYIDLHRNAADIRRIQNINDVVQIDGKRAARMFFVVGTGINADSTAGEQANWKDNYAFALSLNKQLASVNRQLVKPIRVKQGGYYNQDLGLSLLAEIGHNANLLTEAELTVTYFADALQAVCTF